MHLYCGVSKARGREYGGITDNGDTLACLCHKQRVSNETMHIKMEHIHKKEFASNLTIDFFMNLNDWLRQF